MSPEQLPEFLIKAKRRTLVACHHLLSIRRTTSDRPIVTEEVSKSVTQILKTMADGPDAIKKLLTMVAAKPLANFNASLESVILPEE